MNGPGLRQGKHRVVGVAEGKDPAERPIVAECCLVCPGFEARDGLGGPALVKPGVVATLQRRESGGIEQGNGAWTG